ncbi:uncharacterized protein EV420DRAFT_497108 [Desarmillaria tabescens]|uniref:Uncharacterized protein n=1 Tax=Armillaria tabescens TaxID=1929756 RepID=A0AA39KCS5_ARMTA|nr:uncharacterized protein EV420DRAFT_497108 [Desarmillaria tabescens]KAK0457481.1 hypothetical protein EV420DRAFT_497108 [Desarmillaria tabescens]
MGEEQVRVDMIRPTYIPGNADYMKDIFDTSPKSGESWLYARPGILKLRNPLLDRLLLLFQVSEVIVCVCIYSPFHGDTGWSWSYTTIFSAFTAYSILSGLNCGRVVLVCRIL